MNNKPIDKTGFKEWFNLENLKVKNLRSSKPLIYNINRNNNYNN